MEPTKDYGWRFLAVGEEIKQGDQYWSGNCWIERSCYGVKQGDYGDGWNGLFATRRRIDPGEGWEIIPATENVDIECESTDDGVEWIWNKVQSTRTVGEWAKNSGRIAYRRRKQSEWINLMACCPSVGDKIWINHNTLGTLLTIWKGVASERWTHWRPVKPSEIPQPPFVKKSQEELDKEASAKWYCSDSDNEDTLCEQALRQAYEAGLRAGRAK